MTEVYFKSSCAVRMLLPRKKLRMPYLSRDSLI